MFRYAVVAVMLASACLQAQPGKKSQLATISQIVDRAKIDIIYRRPVARGRELFGKLVPWDKAWTPSADSAAIFTTSVDLTVAGSRLRAGSYAIWMIPGANEWSVVFSSDVHAFHLSRPQMKDEVLRVRARPESGEHVESLLLYFPMVDADSAVLAMHWGKTIVPIAIKVR
jgi:Protein of unknown function (DUF2911)